MIDYRQLEAFAAVLDAQSFDKAALRLHLTQSAVSQRVKQLEESIGQILIIRSQPPRPTPAGQQMLRHYRLVTLLQGELKESLQAESRQGFTRLAVGLNADSLATWFLEAVGPLLAQARLLLDLRVDDQDQTQHFLRQGEVIGCISASAKPMQGCSCQPLGMMYYRALATPAFRRHYFARQVRAEDFLLAPAVEFNSSDELQGRYLTQFFDLRSGDYPRHCVPSPQGFLEMVSRGLAWGMIPDQQSQALIEQEVLVDLTPGKSLAVPLYWHAWNLPSETARALSRCLIDYSRRHLACIPDATG